MKKFLMMALAVLGIVAANGCKANENVETVKPQEFQQRLDNDSLATLLDVRKPEEYAEGHLKGATLMNWLDRSAFEREAKKLDKSKTVYVYCRSGRRSSEAANYLAGQDFKVVDMQGGYLAWTAAGLPIDNSLYETDTFTTDKGRKVAITFIKHGTLMMQVDGYTIHIDPVKMFGTDFTKLPKADLLLVTHEHADHYDLAAIKDVSKDITKFISNGRVAQLSGMSEAMKVGEARKIGDITLTATAAYNTTPDRQKFHPKGRDVGFLIDIDDLRIYVSGDTEDIPEMAELKDVDIAFLSTNQPYTMTAQQCINAIKMISPKIVYPYHYGDTDLTPIVETFKTQNGIEVRVRQMQ